ncbi:hypothetical protein [Nitrospira lenta]|uniref:hypothetical protein n=1 Tax=Nitrospira lenta TaxID=1436998 RepID=UPI0015E88A04|nr:hypothetical protein [Nitrospira lenta]
MNYCAMRRGRVPGVVPEGGGCRLRQLVLTDDGSGEDAQLNGPIAARMEVGVPHD